MQVRRYLARGLSQSTINFACEKHSVEQSLVGTLSLEIRSKFYNVALLVPVSVVTLNGLMG